MAEAVYGNIQNLSEANLRNFTSDQVDVIMKNMECLLKKVTSSGEWKEKMLVSMTMIFFNS